MKIQWRCILMNLGCELIVLSLNELYLKIMIYVDECNQRGDWIGQH